MLPLAFATRSQFPLRFRGCTTLLVLGLTVVLASASTPPPLPSPTLLEQALTLDEAPQGKRDAAAVATLYRQAAEAGDAFAHLRLGYLSETGNGVPQDYAAARAHYQAAVDADLSAARVRLAMCHLQGWGGPVDRDAFVRELRLAGEAGEVSAQQMLARVYFLGLGVPEDKAEALRWLELAAKQDSAEAQYQIGRHLEVARARALQRDMDPSRDWYELAAGKEYQASMRAMARTFLFAPRTERNWTMAHQWLELATKTGDAEAPYILAFAELLHPDAPTRDVAKARAWLELAKTRGNDRATEVLLLAASGRDLTSSMRDTMSQAADDRYVARTNRSTAALPGSVHPPRLIRAVHPVYPQALRLAQVSGVVEIEFTVDVTGAIVDPKIVKSDHPLMSEVALETIVRWQFHPAEKDGVPLNARARVPMKFNVDEETLDGVDGLLRSATFQAEKLGTIPRGDYQELRPARFRSQRPPAVPVALPDGETIPADHRAMLIVSLDETGKPLRTHVLHAQPEAVGPVLATWLRSQQFQPRLVDNKAVPSNVVFVHASGSYRQR